MRCRVYVKVQKHACKNLCHIQFTNHGKEKSVTLLLQLLFYGSEIAFVNIE